MLVHQVLQARAAKLQGEWASVCNKIVALVLILCVSAMCPGVMVNQCAICTVTLNCDADSFYKDVRRKNSKHWICLSAQGLLLLYYFIKAALDASTKVWPWPTTSNYDFSSFRSLLIVSLPGNINPSSSEGFMDFYCFFSSQLLNWPGHQAKKSKNTVNKWHYSYSSKSPAEL